MQPGPSSQAWLDWDAAVGRLLREASGAEARLTSLLRVLSGMDGPVAARVLPRDVPGMTAVARDLLPVHVRDPHLLDDLVRWVHAVGRLCELRAAVVHSLWEPAGDESMRAVWSGAPDLPHPRTAAELGRTTAALSRFQGAGADELFLRLDKAAPELQVFARS